MTITIRRTGAQNKGSSAYQVTFPNGEKPVLWSSYATGRTIEDEDQEIARFIRRMVAADHRLVEPDLEAVPNSLGDSDLIFIAQNA